MTEILSRKVAYGLAAGRMMVAWSRSLDSCPGSSLTPSRVFFPPWRENKSRDHSESQLPLPWNRANSRSARLSRLLGELKEKGFVNNRLQQALGAAVMVRLVKQMEAPRYERVSASNPFLFMLGPWQQIHRQRS